MPQSGHELDLLWLRSLRTVDVSVHALLDPVRLGASVPQAAALLARFRPDVIYTTGGYVSVPVLMAAAPARIPSLLWEGNRIPGRSVRVTARLARAIGVSFQATCEALPGNCFVTGTPIRSFEGVDRAAARASFGLPQDVPLALVFGGSQAVRRLNAAVADALPRLVDGIAVMHLTGESGYAAALRRREALPEDQRARYRPYPFLRDEMAQALVAADLIVGRAGSSTLAEATALGLPMVVVPYPHAAAHQEANARELVDGGAAELVRDEDFDGDALMKACAILSDPGRRARMAEASTRLGRPGAAAATAELLLGMAEGQPLPDAARIERLSRERA
ncbi:MAG: UDP-N-acetylglucosamine--N-acetylmuramyl-(pentapeptide) pyrophosphoryl-undecaprenol [Chloroflexota bacterium]|nr:UDP-N-acetylglucosamine--N-acetylmuramyl-(pentapeptide) pyrophosphoryl-undecaprenol [Chloroflexota bacterium]